MEFKYKYNTRTLLFSALYTLLLLLLATAAIELYDGGYIVAWYISFILAAVALVVLSIPRKIILDDDGIEIRCVMDTTRFEYSKITSVRRVDAKEMRFFIPIFASFGFFGFFGYYLNLKSMDLAMVYAKSWNNFIEITDIYEDKYFLSYDEREELVRCIKERL